MLIDQHDRIGFNVRGELVELAHHRLEQLRPCPDVSLSRLGGVGVNRGFQRRILSERGRPRPQFPLPQRFQLREHALRRFERRGHVLADLLPHVQAHDHEDERQQQSDGHHGDRQRLHDEPRRPQRLHGTASTGSDSSMSVCCPALTSMVRVRSPTRSCQPTMV